MSKTYALTIPKVLVENIQKKLNLTNPPQETIKIVSVWCVSQMLNSDCLNDFKIAVKDPQKILEILAEETKADLEELEEQK